MSLKLGTQDIAGISQNTKYNAHHLLDFKWTDCIMNDVSWLRADTFSWQSGDVYTSAYNHLVADLQGITAETETIGSYTVTFYRATDGHKICLADQENIVTNIYNESSIAWYYIVDTVNTQFKLPRTKFGFEGLRTNVGDNIDEKLPNITGGFRGLGENSASSDSYERGAFKAIATGDAFRSTSGNDVKVWDFNASRSSSAYQDNAPVQERATQMYLYFYVGDYTQTAIEQTAGLNAELFNGKMDVDGTNAVNNLSASASEYFTGLSFPSNVYENIAASTGSRTLFTYTAPADGWVAVSNVRTANAGYFVRLASESITQCDVTQLCDFTIPVRKGASVIMQTSNSTTFTSFDYCRFIYAKGEIQV